MKKIKIIMFNKQGALMKKFKFCLRKKEMEIVK